MKDVDKLYAPGSIVSFLAYKNVDRFPYPIDALLADNVDFASYPNYFELCIKYVNTLILN
jgi:hypothetical protein